MAALTPGLGVADGVSPSESAPFSALVAKAIAREHGEGVVKDLAVAGDFYCAAAREGDPEGLFGLAWMYANGRGVPRDDAVAGSLFAKAAEAGHAPSERMLPHFSDRGALPECLTIVIAVATNDTPIAIVDEPAANETPPADPFAALSARKKKIVEMVKKIAPTFAVEPALALAVIAAESNFEPHAVSPKDARGLMQLIPDTAARFNVRNAFDPIDNVRGGLKYLRWLLAYYQGQVELVAAAYNAGEGVVDRYGGIPPFPETRQYVDKVMRLFQGAWHPYDPAIAGPSKMIHGAGGAAVKADAPKRVGGQLLLAR